MHEREQELVSLLSKQCTNIEDVRKLLKSLFKGTLEEIPETEMDKYPGYQKHNLSGNNSANILTTSKYWDVVKMLSKSLFY